MQRSQYPLARQQNLVVQPAADELLVFDTTTDKAYVLSPSAAAVWRACDGKRSVQEIANYLNQTVPTNEQVVWYALRQLNDLLQEPVALPNEIAGISRRQFLKRAGLVAGAAAIPVVVTLVAPTPAHAQSVLDTLCCVCNGGIPTVIPGTECLNECLAFCTATGIFFCSTDASDCDD